MSSLTARGGRVYIWHAQWYASTPHYTFQFFMIRHTLPGSCPTVQACTCEPVPRTSADARGTERCRCSRPVAIPPLCQGLRCVRGDRQILSCILYSYHTSFCMPVSDMHIVQLSHFILHACFSSTSHPLRSLFNPQARLTQGGQRLGSECQHRVCTLLQHICLLYTSPSPRDKRQSRMPSSA